MGIILNIFMRIAALLIAAVQAATVWEDSQMTADFDWVFDDMNLYCTFTQTYKNSDYKFGKMMTMAATSMIAITNIADAEGKTFDDMDDDEPPAGSWATIA